MESNVELGNLVIILRLKELYICFSVWSPVIHFHANLYEW